jgi:hypothetical protein
MEIRHLNRIPIDEPDSTNARTGEVLRSWTSQSSSSNEQNLGRSESQLTCWIIEIAISPTAQEE